MQIHEEGDVILSVMALLYVQIIQISNVILTVVSQV